MKSHRYILAVAVPLLALQACAMHRPDSVKSQMNRTASAIQKADDSGEFANSPDELNVAKEKYMQAKVELEGESFGGDRRAMSLARRAQERAEYAAAHPKAATPASWIAPATEGLNSGSSANPAAQSTTP